MTDTPKYTHAEIRKLLEAITPGEDATLNRYDHGGGRLFLPLPNGGRDLIADFYEEDDDD